MLFDDELEKIAKGQNKDDFSSAMGDEEVANPSPGKKKRIKIKSLKSGDDRQKALYDQLLKQWQKSKNNKDEPKKNRIREIYKDEDIKKLKQKIKVQEKLLSTKDKDYAKLQSDIEKARLKINKPINESVEKSNVEKLKDKTQDKSKNDKFNDISKEEINSKVQKIKDERKEISKSIEKSHAEELDEKDQQIDELNSINDEMQNVGKKSDENYQETLKSVRKNEKKLHMDTSFLSDPTPPDENKLKTIDSIKFSLQKAIKAIDIDDVFVSDVVNSPNVITYKMDLSNLSDKDKIKARKKLLSRNSRSIIGQSIGKNESISIEYGDANTINISIPKGTELKDRDAVSFKELITNDKFVSAANDITKLPIAFGKNQNNETETFDFSKTPHLMVSGATKSGKSVFIQSIINSIQMGKSKEDAKMILIDAAKHGAEFGQFKDSEYLDRPLATTIKQAVESLKALSDEVDRRNEFFKSISEESGLEFKNIEGWNSFITKDPNKMTESEKIAFNKIPENKRNKMNRIVCVVDEAKDLFNKKINSQAAKIQGLVDHLLTVARSAGTHLVLATQSPSKSSIPGTIQSNIGAKMTFRLQNKSDAKAIGVPNATDLLMYGDGYFEDPFTGTSTRLQTGFINNEDSAAINERTKGEQNFIEKNKKVETISTDNEVQPSSFSKMIEDTRKKLDEQRERIKSDITQLEKRRLQQDKSESELRQSQESTDQKSRQLSKEQSDIEKKKITKDDLKTPKQESTDINFDDILNNSSNKEEAFDNFLKNESKSEDTDFDIDKILNDTENNESNTEDLQSEIDKLTETKPVEDVKKQMKPENIKENKPENKELKDKKTSFLDRIKKMIGK